MTSLVPHLAGGSLLLAAGADIVGLVDLLHPAARVVLAFLVVLLYSPVMLARELTRRAVLTGQSPAGPSGRGGKHRRERGG